MDLNGLLDIFNTKISLAVDPKLKELSLLPTFTARKNYCDINFTKLKAGSSRIAYVYNDLILKLAKNEKGLAQNQTESDGFMQQNYKDIIANVLDSDPNGLWILVEKAERVNKSSFKTLTNINFDEFCDYIKKKIEYKKVESELDNNHFVQELLDLMINFTMPAGDICRISSWGKVKNRAVLIDYGLTSSIYEEYYK
jgi:hypothetical protein